jgi:hypothetical protein
VKKRSKSPNSQVYLEKESLYEVQIARSMQKVDLDFGRNKLVLEEIRVLISG